jgi:hypothetical protein
MWLGGEHSNIRGCGSYEGEGDGGGDAMAIAMLMVQ